MSYNNCNQELIELTVKEFVTLVSHNKNSYIPINYKIVFKKHVTSTLHNFQKDKNIKHILFEDSLLCTAHKL